MTDAAGTNQNEALLEKLSAYPDSLAKLVLKFREAPEKPTADAIVIEILKYHEPEKFDKVYEAKGDDLVLVSDLGMDSLTMTEIAFEAEDFLDITIQNEDMLAISTVKDLKSFIVQAIPNP